ncbi:hypothetical protein [Natronincola ferrireducens]|uniref:PRC-barrel domain-containing protein n=1 Tax=Natronincola ferrireducens TaxID=393762 RepID=A0A1G8ZX00_9FIRM|nr:hypothetical protein [Natronincola ferrireducens]SDK19164.1 hypothetical protein SAMN05660472_00982 [Natronincola ferrireducens]
MLINVSEKPVIFIENGKFFGTLKGFIFNQNKLAFVYCKAQEKYVYIPIEQVVMGSDAVMLKNSYRESLLSVSSKPEIYTLQGEKIGEACGVEFDEDFQVAAIHTTDTRIEKDDILSMDHIIIINSKKVSPTSASSSPGAYPVENSLDLLNQELSLDNDPMDTTEIPAEEHEGIETIQEVLEDTTVTEELQISQEVTSSIEVQIESSIDPRYNYLLGKELIEDILIADSTFSKGNIIDANLIQLAMDNNAIVKVIMNAED